jgi:hypothetical protein
MAKAVVEEDRLKEIIKTAFVEVLEERGDLVRDLIEEALEDLALGHAIEEVEGTRLVDRDEVFALLERAE